MARQINKALGKFSEVMVYMDWVYKKISTIFFLVAQMTKWTRQEVRFCNAIKETEILRSLITHSRGQQIKYRNTSLPV